MDRFAQWVESVGSQDKAAALLGISQTHVSQMARGERSPGLGTALTIERVTLAWDGGAIRAAEWDQHKGRSKKRRKRVARAS